MDMRFHQGPILSPCQKSGEVRCDVLVGEMAENARLVPPTPSESARMSEKAALVPPSSRWQRSRAAEDILDVGRGLELESIAPSSELIAPGQETF